MDSWNQDRPRYRSHEDLAQFEPLNTPLWVFDVDRHAMWWANPSALVFWRAECLAALLARDYSTDSETVRTRLHQVVDSPSGPSRVQETWTLYPGGKPTTVIVDQLPILIEDGRHAILFEASRVLDLQEDPDALRILEVARSSALMVSSFTMSGRLLTQNPASLSCFEHPVICSGHSDLASRFVDQTIDASILLAVGQEGNFEAELAVRTVNGERIHRVLARKGRDPVTGEFVTVLNEEDMTEQAELRRRLQRLNAELEARVADRTERLQALNDSLVREIEEHQVAEERLRQAQKLEAVGQLTGGIAHDFNNILAAIVGNLDIIEDRGKLDKVDRKSTAVALKAALRGAELTDRLLTFSRQQALNGKLTDINKILPYFQQLAERTIGADITIEMKLAADLWPAVVDAGQLENALLNLAINARDAMPGGGQLAIETANQVLAQGQPAISEDLRPGDYVMIAVRDSGTGMSAEVRERVFEPFFTTKDVGEGSGLGLSMIFGFAKQSGGCVTIHSEESVGTVVRIYLPRADAAVETKEATQTPEGDRPTGTETILVVEDEEDVRDYLVTALERLGYKVLQAEDGPAALEVMAVAGPIDLLLTDVILPRGMSGLDIAAAYHEIHPAAGVLYSSGNRQEALGPRGGLEEGAVLMSKPYQISALARRVREVLDGQT